MIKIGNKIRIKGDVKDFTDHLDNEVLTVIATPGEPDGEDVLLDDDTYYAEDKNGDRWYIYGTNIVEVLP